LRDALAHDYPSCLAVRLLRTAAPAPSLAASECRRHRAFVCVAGAESLGQPAALLLDIAGSQRPRLREFAAAHLDEAGPSGERRVTQLSYADSAALILGRPNAPFVEQDARGACSRTHTEHLFGTRSRSPSAQT